ncbi:MAG: hypothetical protein WCL18_04545 [bacterium]
MAYDIVETVFVKDMKTVMMDLSTELLNLIVLLDVISDDLRWDVSMWEIPVSLFRNEKYFRFDGHLIISKTLFHEILVMDNLKEKFLKKVFIVHLISTMEYTQKRTKIR